MPKSAKKRVLLTGGLGFIGSHVVKRLHRHYDIVVIDNDTSPASRRLADEWRRIGIQIYQDDIAEEETWGQIEPCDFVFHGAAQTSAEHSWKKPILDFLSNVFGTFLVAEYARKNSANVIYCNSIRAYD